MKLLEVLTTINETIEEKFVIDPDGELIEVDDHGLYWWAHHSDWLSPNDQQEMSRQERSGDIDFGAGPHWELIKAAMRNGWCRGTVEADQTTYGLQGKDLPTLHRGLKALVDNGIEPEGVFLQIWGGDYYRLDQEGTELFFRYGKIPNRGRL